MAAFIPGESPPLVSTPIVFISFVLAISMSPEKGLWSVNCGFQLLCFVQQMLPWVILVYERDFFNNIEIYYLQ